MQDHIRQINESPCDARPDHTYGSSAVLLPNYSFGPLRPSQRTKAARRLWAAVCQERTHALQQTASLFNQFVGAGVALLGRLALTVAQNLGIAAELIHDCGRDEFDTR